ncbi:FG-GAP-like repeat-containing protein [Dyadobacter sp. CY343]|uniref:FG-GAP-like repeat-containing protein n=1 Tax=Dyadobacter sp. CY343 TaxID=2907299 RepID=UPI001F35F53D|nr:FG-GAP-like repeat-containing protein [Dyadobacter sp. CY343]MCE7063334.1 FG-GAP-like repeat-containing protein [Dyadobacter sp. CY343]
MKHNYNLSLVLMITLTIAGLWYVFQDTETEPAATIIESDAPVVSVGGTVPADIEKSISQREYHITFDAQSGRYQSPNREHNLRAFYEPGVLTVRNRKDSVGHNFEFKLITKGIYVDNKRIDLVDKQGIIENKNNTAEIRHSTFTEQYINSPEGIRQNFIIEKAPSGTDELSVKLQLKGFKARETGNNTLAFYSEKETNNELVYSGLKCWDASGSPLQATLALSEGDIEINVDVRGAAYPVTIDPIISNGNPGNAIKVPEVNQNQAWMGGVVSSAGDVNGDGYSDVLVGASKYDNGQIDEGAVFVYYGNAAGINMAGGVMLESDQKEARFGSYASSAGDINKDGFSDIIVGAHMYDKGQTNEGAAFVYYGSAQGISKVASLVLESNQAEANMGNTIGLAGDVNGDGYSDVLVCARAYDKGQTNEGVVFLYHGSAAGLNTNNPVIIEANQAEAMMGFCASGAGDVNGDGYSDILVGARLYDKGQTDEGAVFVYHGSALGINPANAATTLESNQATAYLGHTAATAGDVNGDGYSDIIIGANMYDKGQTNEGAAFIHYGSAQGINIVAAATLESNQAEAQFGYSVASAGDVNGDGYADVIVGAMFYDNGQSNEGAAFVYPGSQTSIAETAISTLESNQAGAQLGSNVASAGDVNGDGYSDVIVGAITYDNGNVDEGGAFVWVGGGSGDYLDAGLIKKIDQRMNTAGAGDINGDGFSDIIVGVPSYDEHGAVFIYNGSLSGINFNSFTIIENVPNSGDLGCSVASAGDVNGDGFGDIVIGDFTYFVKVGQQSEMITGAALVYYGSSLGIKINSPTILPSNKSTSLMGWSVASAGDINGDGYDDLIVGDEAYDNGQSDEGAALIYHGSQNGVILNAAIVIEGNSNFAQFGYSVSTAGDVNGDGYSDIIIGAPYYTGPESHEGATYLYYGSPNGISVNSMLMLQKNQANAGFGTSVASAGDLNGDGFSDVIIGADQFSSGSYEEGAAFVYYGGASGLNAASVLLECNIQGANMGRTVATAGDLNGDGYSDVVIGIPNFPLQQIMRGTSMVFYGSSAGIPNGASPAFFLNNINPVGPFSTLDLSASTAGDVDGDGLSDLLMTSYVYNYDSFTEKSLVVVYHGSASQSIQNNLRLYNTNLTTPINQSQFAQNNFGAGLHSKSFLGGNKGKLVWETKAAGQGFSKGANNVITNSTQSSGSQNIYASLGLVGTELKNVIPKQGPATKVRVRVKYDPALALTGQTYGPWRYLSSYLTGNGTAPVPDEGMQDQFEDTVSMSESESEKVRVYPNPVSDKISITQISGEIKMLRLRTKEGKTVHQSFEAANEISVLGLAPGLYILSIDYENGTQSSHRVVVK